MMIKTELKITTVKFTYNDLDAVLVSEVMVAVFGQSDAYCDDIVINNVDYFSTTKSELMEALNLSIADIESKWITEEEYDELMSSSYDSEIQNNLDDESSNHIYDKALVLEVIDSVMKDVQTFKDGDNKILWTNE